MGGPAGAHGLMLGRAPYLLRVVVDRETGVVDALDQLDDVPRSSEDIYVYRLVSRPMEAHVCARGGCSWVASGVYRHVPDAPAEELRDTDRWRAWAAARYDADLASAAP